MPYEYADTQEEEANDFRMLVLSHTSYGAGQQTSQISDNNAFKFTLTVTYSGGCDPGDVVQIEIEDNGDEVTLDGLHVNKYNVLEWLDRLLKWKREEASEE